MATEQTILRMFGIFCAVYPTQRDEALDTVKSVWLEVLSDVPDKELLKATNDYLRSPERWRPAPGVLRNMALNSPNLVAKRTIDALEDSIR